MEELEKADVIPELRQEGKPAAKDGAKDMESGSDTAGGSQDGEVPAVGAGHPDRTPGMLRDMRKSRVFGALTKGANFDIHEVIETDSKINTLHSNAEQFDKKTELSFKYLQVFTAMCNSFAHGSNDVANAIGPYAGIYAVWRCTCVQSKSDVPVWILVVDGFGLVFGLATYGYKIMRVLGVKMVWLTNSRGYCVELAAAAIIIVGSAYGLPLSTTHCMVGAVTGIGVVEAVSDRRPEGATGRKQAFNWLLLAKFFCGWIATLVVAALTAAAFTAQGVYAPYRLDTDARVTDATSLNAPANAVAGYMSNSSATSANSALFAEQANAMLAACSAEAVPKPPVSFNPITACVTTVMEALNATTWA